MDPSKLAIALDLTRFKRELFEFGNLKTFASDLNKVCIHHEFVNDRILKKGT